MIIISFIIGFLLGWYIVRRINTQINKPSDIELIQENDDDTDGNIQIGSINWKEEE